MVELEAPEELFVEAESDSPLVTPPLAAMIRRAGLPLDEEAIRMGIDPRYAREAASLSRLRVVGRLRGWETDGSVYVLRFPSGLRVTWEPGEKWARRSVSERVARLTGLIYVEAERCGPQEWCAARVVFLRPGEDREAAKRLLEAVEPAAGECGVSPLAAAFAALHLRRGGCGSVLALGLRYVLLAQRGQVHWAEWSVKATLKSTVFSIIDAYDNGWHVAGEAPSLATLIGDARTGDSRLHATDIIMFDEVGSWRLQKSLAGEFWAALRTGMANCRWRRSRGGAKTVEVEKCIATYWAGNPLAGNAANIPPMELHRMWLRGQGLDGEELLAMLSRYAGAWGIPDDRVATDMMADLRTETPAPGVVKALLGLARRVAAEKAREAPRPPSGLGDRRLRYWRRVYGAAAAVLGDGGDAGGLAEALARGLLVVKADGWDTLG